MQLAKKNQKIYVDRKYFSRYEDQVLVLLFRTVPSTRAKLAGKRP